jgi:hypothetical protein
MPTNVDELKAHLKAVYGKMFTSKEFERRAFQAGEKMQESVQQAMANSSHDLQQSYRLKREISTETPDVFSAPTKVRIGFGHIPSLNKYTLRPPQRGTFIIGGQVKTIRLVGEKELPSWIIMEFGRKGTSYKASTVPSFIKKEISYSTREDKPFMIGPSTSSHFKNHIFFMANKGMLAKHHSEIPSNEHKRFKRHPGIKESAFFRDGLENSKQKVFNELSVGIYHSLVSLSRKNGGTGRVTML